MFGKPIKLFSAWGFPVGVDPSWFIVAVLVTWSLAGGLFPTMISGLDSRTYWSMGVAGSLALFACIIVHEMAHARTALWYGLQIRGITLFIFGGVAEMREEPPTARSEFAVAIAGPLASIALAVGFLLSAGAAGALEASPAVLAVLRYLAWINLVVVLFNLVPAFPLDGGRVLRSALWHWRGNLRWATRITSTIGSGFGILLIVLGVFSFVNGSFIGGIWWLLIGMFLRNAAQMSYRQLVVRETLEGEPVLRFMHQDPDTVPESAHLRAG